MELTTLSWMLLAADRAENVGKFVAIFFVLSLVFAVGRGCVVAFDNEVKEMGLKKLPLWVIVFLIGWGIPMVVVGLIPSTTVILQVAAIELGDNVLNSDEFQRILKAYVPKEE